MPHVSANSLNRRVAGTPSSQTTTTTNTQQRPMSSPTTQGTSLFSPTACSFDVSPSTPASTPRNSQRQPHNLTRAACLLFALLLIAASGFSPAQGFPRNRRHFFTTCWGWGASCSLYGRSRGGSSDPVSSGRSVQVVKVPSRPAQARRTNPFDILDSRTSGRLPSPFSSSNWGAGTMGKRTPQYDYSDMVMPLMADREMGGVFLERLRRAAELGA